MELSVLQYFLFFAVIPLVVLLVVVLAVMGPRWTRAGAYRPGEPWNHPPVIIGGAETGDVRAALTTTDVGELGMAAETDVVEEVSLGSEGGASVRW